MHLYIFILSILGLVVWSAIPTAAAAAAPSTKIQAINDQDEC